MPGLMVLRKDFKGVYGFLVIAYLLFFTIHGHGGHVANVT